MKVVFLCNRLSRTKLRGSWAQLAAEGASAAAAASGPSGQDSPAPPDSPDVSNMATGNCLDPEVCREDKRIILICVEHYFRILM